MARPYSRTVPPSFIFGVDTGGRGGWVTVLAFFLGGEEGGCMLRSVWPHWTGPNYHSSFFPISFGQVQQVGPAAGGRQG